MVLSLFVVAALSANADVVDGFTGPFDLGPLRGSVSGNAEQKIGNWTLLGGGGFVGDGWLTLSVAAGQSNVRLTESAEISIVVPDAGKLTVTAAVRVGDTGTGVGSGGGGAFVDDRNVGLGDGPVVLHVNAGDRVGFRAFSSNGEVGWHPGLFLAGPEVTVALSSLRFEPAPAVPLGQRATAVAGAEVVNGFVLRANVSAGGWGYRSRPGVRLVGGGGVGAKAFAVVEEGRVTAIVISDPGRGYFAAPTVEVDPPGGPTGGRLVTWGSGIVGADIGGSGKERFSFVAAGGRLLTTVTDGASWSIWPGPGTPPSRPGTFGPITAVSASSTLVLALQGNGRVTGWGGDGDMDPDPPLGVQGRCIAAAAGDDHAVVVLDDGTAVAWGSNFAGQTEVPAGLSGLRAVAAGASHSLALKADGTVVAWGANPDGQCNVPAGLDAVAAVASAGNCSLALKADGTVVAWGNNDLGQTNVPPGLGNVVAVATGGRHCLALRADGTVVGWGDNGAGQLNVPGGLGRVTAIAAGRDTTVALAAPAESLAIRPSVTVALGLMPGQRYQLQSSDDLTVWTNAESAFVADSESQSRVFEATDGRRYFRLVPQR